MAESKTMRAAAAYALVAAAVLSTSTSSTGVAAVPMPNQRSPESSSGSAGAVRSFPISRRQPSKHRSGDELRAWANRHRSGLRNKYGLNKGNKESANSRRDSAGSATLVNYEHDSTWYASVEMGTPSQSFDLVLDTGSSDLWVSADHYNSASSSSFKNSSTPFQITYGSGQVAGNLATDTVTLAGHTVNSQTFAIADQVSQGLLDGNVAGIMGMGFQSLASSRAPPFWQNADLSDDTFAFFLNREIDQLSSSSNTTYGGVFTLGGTNSSLYQGTVNYVDVIDESYWLVTLGGLSANNDSISLGTSNKAAIDTGTTLIGGPDSVVSSFYSKIAGSAPMSGSEGYYTYPCNSDVSVTMTFGNQQYSLNSADFEAGTVDSSGTSCLGALFELGATSSSTLNWIIGDAFLKNVYSIFTASGSSAKVGFAKLAEGLNDGGTSAKTVAQTSGSNDSSPAITLGAPKMASSLIAATAVVALTVALAAF